MLDPNNPFYQARLKHDWANQHISKAQSIWQSFLETDFCEIVVTPKHEISAQTGGQVTAVGKPLPADLILAIGDSIHNLRVALDFTINEIMRGKKSRVTFPARETKEELISSFSTEGQSACTTCGKGGKGRGGNAVIEETVVGIGDFIVEKIRPYRTDDGLIWPIGKLDNIDKHRFLVPLLVPLTIECFNITDQNHNSVGHAIAQINPDGSINLFGSEGNGHVTIESVGKMTADIFFNESGVMEGKRVFPTLDNMAKEVSETIYKIEEFVTEKGWKPA